MIIKARVIAKTTVNNQPTEIGDIVEVDENTFRNLELKGRLEAVASGDEKKPTGRKSAAPRSE